MATFVVNLDELSDVILGHCADPKAAVSERIAVVYQLVALLVI